MTTLPTLTEDQIRDWTDGRSFARGHGYYRSNAITHPRVRGNTLKAQCRGSMLQPYRVEVTLDDQGIASGSCSCPVGYGGQCKHAVALLLTWLYRPEGFQVEEEVAINLEQRSKEELIALIQRMLDREPELETLLAMPMPGSSAAAPLQSEIIEQQVQDALYDIDYEWGASFEAAAELAQIVAQGDDYTQAGDWRNAVTVYATVAQELMAEYDELPDEEGELAGVLNQCAEGLGHCLAAVDDGALRQSILETLFAIFAWDVEAGGIDAGDNVEEHLTERTTPEEKRLIAGWVREALPVSADESWSSGWRRQVFGGLLLRLEAETLDDEAYLRICRETGRTRDLVRRLLERGRIEEAATTAAQESDYPLLHLADLFREAGHTDVAEDLVRRRADASHASHLVEWLIERATERGDHEEALTLAVPLFERERQLGRYAQVKALAQKAGRWDTLRPQLLEKATQAKEFSLLTQIYLEEKQIDQALDSLERLERASARGYWAPGSLRLQVARAAQEKRPRAAIDLYRREVQRLIEARGRDNYAVAASYLRTIRDLYRHLGEEDRGAELIARIRNENPRLRALKDELNKAGL